MKSVVIYDSRFGNTKVLSEAMGAALQVQGPVRVLSVDEAVPESPVDADLLVVGGPTHDHGMRARCGASWKR